MTITAPSYKFTELRKARETWEKNRTMEPEALAQLIAKQSGIDEGHAAMFITSWNYMSSEQFDRDQKKHHAAPKTSGRIVEQGEKAAPVPVQGSGKCAAIVKLYQDGLTRKEIVAKGYSSSTVNVQVAKYEKDNNLARRPG